MRYFKILLISLIIVVSFCSFKDAEPPFSMGKPEHGGAVRKINLISLDPKEEMIIYEVHYLYLNLTSIVTLDLNTRALLKEVFVNRWVIIYHYDDLNSKYIHAPTRITIYKYGSKENPVGVKVNEYSMIDIPRTGIGLYQGSNGKRREIEASYFDIIR